MSESPFLLDVNVLVALAWPNHVHHDPVKSWFLRVHKEGWRTCSITQSAFIRISSSPVIIEDAVAPREALKFLKRLTAQPGHQFIPESIDWSAIDDIPLSLFHGHRQITDVYLLFLARHTHCRLATLDNKLVQAVQNTPMEDTLYPVPFRI